MDELRATAQYHKWWNMVEFLLGEWYESTPYYHEYTPLGGRAPLWRLYYELERDYLLRQETDDEQDDDPISEEDGIVRQLLAHHI
jgi:hypothetical protein